jgi:hypothetical protein
MIKVLSVSGLLLVLNRLSIADFPCRSAQSLSTGGAPFSERSTES